MPYLRRQPIEKQAFISVLFFLMVLVSVIFSCQSTSDQPSVRVMLPNTSLRDMPGERGREIRVLAARDLLTDLGGVSNFESQLRIGDQSIIAPWLQVKTRDGETGWVFSGTVMPEPEDENWLLNKRMRCYFGDDLTLRRNRWWNTQASIADETDFAVFYHEALALRDTFTYHLAHRAEPNAADVQSDFLWLREALPGFVYQRVAQGTQPYLFTDYRFFQVFARRTTGNQDDELMMACLTAYPMDSIESIAPVWVKQIDEKQVVSQLGLGHHWEMLQLIDIGLQHAGGLFEHDFSRLKETILDDVLDKDVLYWQSEEKILTELGKILGSQLTSLTPADRAAVERRWAMFQNPAANGIQVNLRSGQ